MIMTWYVVYDDATGFLVSVGEVLPAVIPSGLIARDVGMTRPGGQDWDSATRDYVTRIPEVITDPVADTLDTAGFEDMKTAWAGLTLRQQDEFRGVLENG